MADARERAYERATITGWAERRKRNLYRLQETSDFERGWNAALDDLMLLLLKRDQDA